MAEQKVTPLTTAAALAGWGCGRGAALGRAASPFSGLSTIFSSGGRTTVGAGTLLTVRGRHGHFLLRPRGVRGVGVRGGHGPHRGGLRVLFLVQAPARAAGGPPEAGVGRPGDGGGRNP